MDSWESESEKLLESSMSEAGLDRGVRKMIRNRGEVRSLAGQLCGKMAWRGLLGCLLGVSLLFLAACGNPVAPDAEPPAASLSGSEDSDRELYIYCEIGERLQMIDEDGKLSGLTVDVVREIQKRVGNNDPIEVVPWARGYDDALSNPNTILFSMSRTKERNHLFDWVGPVSEITFGFWALADSTLTISSLDDAKKVGAIGVYQNDVRDLYLTEAGFTNLERTTDQVQSYKKLLSGRIDLYAESAAGIEGDAARAGATPGQVKMLYPFLTTQLFIAISKGTPPEVTQVWREAFAQMQADGTFKKLYKKYYPERELPGPEIVNFE